MIDSLIRLCNKFNKKYYVNEGGCIYLAYIISKHFNDFKVCEYYDSNNDPFHVSLIIDDIIIINKPDNTYDGYSKPVILAEKPVWILNLWLFFWHLT